MITIENLEALYKYLEEDEDSSVFDTKRSKHLSILSLRDKIEDIETKKKCSYELFFNDFSIQKGEHLPNWQMGDDIYPSLELFDDNFEYIKARSISVQNPKYKAKYNHLLWLSPVKNIGFARQALESYISILENFKFSASDNLICRSFKSYFENAFLLCQEIKYKKDEIVTFFLRVLPTDDLNDFAKCAIMKFIVENSKKPDKVILQEFFKYSNYRIIGLESKTVEFYLELLIILSRKLGLDPSKFHESFGDYHLMQIKKDNREGFVTHIFYLNALKEYKKANNKQKIEETTVLLEQAKKKLDLKRISFELKDEGALQMLNMLWDSITAQVNNLIENGDSKDIYSYLIYGKLLPNSQEQNEDAMTSFLLDSITTMTYDINKNVSKKKSGRIDPYALHISNFTARHIGLVVIKGIKSGKVSFESFMHFLKEFSWYKEDFTYIDSNEERQGFDWIELLTPSLQSFFVQMEHDITLEKDNHKGYILPIDSLVLKFEGLIRELSVQVGAQTIEIRDDETQARISFEKLLENEKVKGLIPPDDLTFFKYLFTSEGINLRNNVAHGFLKTENYNAGTMLLLLVALLRLGNFKFVP